jgi:hypothetical protein
MDGQVWMCSLVTDGAHSTVERAEASLEAMGFSRCKLLDRLFP